MAWGTAIKGTSEAEKNLSSELYKCFSKKNTPGERKKAGAKNKLHRAPSEKNKKVKLEKEEPRELALERISGVGGTNIHTTRKGLVEREGVLMPLELNCPDPIMVQSPITGN